MIPAFARTAPHDPQGFRIAEDVERESRLALALLRGVIENLKPNRLMMPLFAAAMCAMFSAWVKPLNLGIWYGLVVLSLLPQIALTYFMPRGPLPPEDVRKWLARAAFVNVIYVAAWTSMVFLLWVPDNDFNHLFIQFVLAATLTAHASLVGSSRQIAIPAFCVYGLMMTVLPLRSHSTVYYYLAATTPFYVGYVAVMARQHYVRAKAALILGEERNALLAELVHAKLESDRRRERAEAASLAKSQFLANMSHELRTPLNAIIGFSELICTRIFESEPDRNYEYTQLIHGSGLHLLALINDILDLAKIEAGRWKLEEADLDLNRMAQDSLQLVTWKAKDNDVALENDIAADVPLLHADERAIKQILINLLSNAVKFTHAGGQVRVFAHQGENGRFIFGVADTGIGIAEGDLARVFDSFGQGKHDVAIADKGTGLGLAIVKGLADAHGATVSLESVIGKGTRVTLSFPASRLRLRQAALRAG